MRRMLSTLLASAAFLLTNAVSADSPSDATTLFARYKSLEAAFDAGIADPSADDAFIRNCRTYPNSQERGLVIPAPQYKQLLRAAMPLAQAKGYYSPISLLVAPTRSGARVIREALSESQP